jgi:hypothetical protein
VIEFSTRREVTVDVVARQTRDLLVVLGEAARE